MARAIGCFFVPWLAFFALGGLAMAWQRAPGALVLFAVFATVCIVGMARDAQKKADTMLDDAERLTRQRQNEDHLRAIRQFDDRDN